MNYSNQTKDYKWFLKNYSKLFNEYGASFLAIKDKAVIGVYNSYAEGVKETSKNNDLGTFIVQRCDGSEGAYTNYISTLNFA